MALDLPTYIPLEKAAEQFNVAVETLRQNIEDGAVRAAKTPAGGLLVAGEDVGELKTKLSLEAKLDSIEVDKRLRGKPIRASEAAEKYRLRQGSLTRWADAGYIRIIERGPKLLILDEGDVKRAAEIFHYAEHQTGSYIKAGWILKHALSPLLST
jgi:predicted site-specific integrase-resolvase